MIIYKNHRGVLCEQLYAEVATLEEDTSEVLSVGELLERANKNRRECTLCTAKAREATALIGPLIPRLLVHSLT